MIFAALGLFLALVLLFIFVQVGLVTVAFAKLGMTPGQGFLVLLATLLGSGVNIPVHKTSQMVRRPVLRGSFMTFGSVPYRLETEAELVDQVIAVNLGGCVIPCVLSLFFLSQTGLQPGVLLALGLTTAVCYALARPIPGRGIGVPVLLPPLVAALSALIFAPEGLGPLAAYISGTVGDAARRRRVAPHDAQDAARAGRAHAVHRRRGHLRRHFPGGHHRRAAGLGALRRGQRDMERETT